MLSSIYIKNFAIIDEIEIDFHENMFFCKNGNLQKHIVLVNLGLREYQNRIQHVHKSAHAKYELCSCQERRVMTILRPPGAKIQEEMVPANPRSHAKFKFLYSISCF